MGQAARCVLQLMNSSLQKDYERRRTQRAEHKVPGNVLNVLSLTGVLHIHHFHLDGALITELCRLLSDDSRHFSVLLHTLFTRFTPLTCLVLGHQDL